jgi:eukaryotic-like serine/threonine-protein kinase
VNSFDLRGGRVRIGSRISHYEVLEHLEGGEGRAVYQARDTSADRLVALELLTLPGTVTAEDRERCLREAGAALALDHPNVCPAYEVGETAEGELFLALALAPGETLAARLKRRSLAPAEALDIAAQIAAGVTAAHERGIVHRHLEPRNVRISPDERVQVAGFGFAPLAGGTLAYRSPEQLRGGPADDRSDIWALGVVLYEMLAGQLPFTGTDEEMARAIEQYAPVPLAQRRSGLPRSVRQIVDRALAKGPAARYARIEEMRAELSTASATLPDDETATDLEGGAPRLPPTVANLLTGRRISHFLVAERLGGGGMGVVYRAKDTRLGRTVALKFLTPELASSPVAKARFLTEARAASALEHPSLCTILDVGETEEGLLFLAMPLYEGESLDRRMDRGPLPLAEALDIATQTARGLAKAHRHGIVHRDIKPANLFWTSDGVIKVLDFGIAKLLGESGPTREGALMGTPYYMAPEQTRGDQVDARADVWSLGVVLYQMLAGRPPFAGGSEAAVVHAVLNQEPEPLARLRPDVPPEIERIVARMLEKNPERRQTDAGEVLSELRRVQDLPPTLVPAPAPERRRRIGPPTLLALALTAGIVGLAGVLLLSTWHRRGEPGGPQATDFRQLTDEPGKETSPSLSPDGTLFVYARSAGGKSDIFLRHVGGGNPLDLTADSPADDTQPAFSPDGQQIAFRSEREGGGIFLMGAMGESVRRLTDFGFNPAWSPDGREIAVATEGAFDPAQRNSSSKIVRVNVQTEARRPLDLPDGVQPSWSPHGWRIAYWGLAQPGAHRAIWTVPVDGGAPVTVVDDALFNWSPVWSPDGRFLYFASNRGGSMNLWRVAIDERSGRVLGPLQPITLSAQWSALPSFARDGRHLVYATSDQRSFVEQVALDPESGRAVSSPVPVFQGARSIWACEPSPDGTWLALRSGSPQEDLFVIQPDGRQLRQLTNDGARDRAPHWAPDGHRILFYSNRSGKYEAWTIRPDGSGLTQVTHLPNKVINPFWSPDGRSIGFTYGARGTALLDLAGSPTGPRLLPPVAGGQVFSGQSWSADGRFLTGQLLRRDESPVPGVVLWSLATNAPRRLTQTGTDPIFFHTGNRILFVEPAAIKLVEVGSGEVRTLLSPPPASSSYVSASVGPGDRTLCTVRSTDEGDIWIVSLANAAGHP